MPRILIMAGGTGGHVIPALTVAEELIRQGVKISWVGTNRPLEARLVSQTHIELDMIKVEGIRRSGFRRKLAMPIIVFKAMRQCFTIFKKRHPNVILGMGGFVAGPGGLVALILRIPLVLHEQNTVAGMTNKWLSKLSRHVLTGFPVVDGLKKSNWVGNPVREGIIQLPMLKERMLDRKGPLRILVIGGSQGAEVFNVYLASLLMQCKEAILEVRHQCGSGNEKLVRDSYTETQISCQVSEFINDMASAYQWSDVVICRSGAMTVSEICVVGAVGILVPYPHAVSDHQTKNADYLVSQNAAKVVNQEDFIKGKWVSVLHTLNQRRHLLLEMGTNARRLAKINATKDIANCCLELLHA